MTFFLLWAGGNTILTHRRMGRYPDPLLTFGWDGKLWYVLHCYASGYVWQNGLIRAPGGSVVDTLTKRGRSERMALVRSKHTKPELAIRRLVHGMGFRYRLHGNKLPGRPDLVFPARRKAIFVHGCFWHRHRGCKLARIPKSRVRFWKEKLEGNRKRDARNMARIRRLGWSPLVIWECQLGKTESLSRTRRKFLEKGGNKK